MRSVSLGQTKGITIVVAPSGDHIQRPNNIACSVIFCALKNPRPDVIENATRQRLVSEWHAYFGRCPPVYERDEAACVGLSRYHDRPEFGPFHQTVVTRKIKSARLIALSTRLMAGDAPSLDDRDDVVGVTQPKLSRAGLVNRHDSRGPRK